MGLHNRWEMPTVFRGERTVTLHSHIGKQCLLLGLCKRLWKSLVREQSEQANVLITCSLVRFQAKWTDNFTKLLRCIMILKSIFRKLLLHLPGVNHYPDICVIARSMGPTWGPSGANRTQVDPMLVPGTLLSGLSGNSSNFTVPILCSATPRQSANASHY